MAAGALPPDVANPDRQAVGRKIGASLRRHRDQIMKNWLKSLIDDLGLASLKEFPTGELARDLPGLIALVAEQVEAGASGPEPGQLAGIAATIGSVRKEDPGAGKLLSDFARLKLFMLRAVLSDLRRSDRAIVENLITLDAVFCQLLELGLPGGATRGAADAESAPETDNLTDLYNVRYFRRQLHRQLELFKRYRTPFSLIMLDLDGLEQLNAALGMAAGDAALRNLAAILLEEKRDTDIAVRYGDDEFFLILPGTVTEEGERLAYRISRRVKELNLMSRGERMTGVSIGIVSCPENGTDVGTLRSRADKAMYMAKLLGGNRVARYLDFEQT